MSRISITVPVYKVESYLNRCVDSILAQSFSDFELILVDDGSPDNCGTICDEYAGKDSRVTVIHQENGGLSAARNAGIEYALKTDSEWLTFIDSDDWIHPEYLNYLYYAAVEHSVDVSVCGFQRTSGEEAAIGDTSFRIDTPEELWCRDRVNATVAWGKLYRKRLFDTVRYPVGKIHEDEYTTYRLLFACDKIAVTDAETYYYFQNPTGIMKSKWTPKRLAQPYAFREQTSFFRDNHFDSAWETSERACLSSFAAQYRSAKASDAYKSFTPQIKSALKDEYKKCKTPLKLNVRTDTAVYMVLYPFRTRVYCIIHNGLSLLKTEGLKGVFRKIKSKFFPSERK